jgi:hypothetical protein
LILGLKQNVGKYEATGKLKDGFERTRPLGKPRRRWEENIRRGLKETGWE